MLLPISCAKPHQKQRGLTSSLQLIHQNIPSLNLHLQQTISRFNTKSQVNQQWELAQVSLHQGYKNPMHQVKWVTTFCMEPLKICILKM